MAGLSKFIERLNRLEGPAWRLGIAYRVAQVALKQIERSFRSESDPYGRPWEPLKKERTGKILQRTGWLKNSFLATISPDSVRIGSAATYGGFHQYGTRRIPARSMVPNAEKGLGSWQESIDKTIRDGLREALKNAR